MILNHMNLVVPDVESTANFFVKHFNFKLQQPLRLKYIAVLHGTGDFVLVISNFPNTTTYTYPKDFHIGFYQPDRHSVDLLYNQLRQDLNIDTVPGNIRDRYGFYFYAPGEILIEITCAQ